MGLRLTTAPTVNPVSLQEAKNHLAIVNEDFDTEIDLLVKAATELAQNHTGRAFITQSYTWTLDGFPCKLLVPRPRLQSVTHIKYVDDSTGVLTTLDSSEYRVSSYNEPATIEPAWNESWPTPRPVSESVEVEFVAGYGAGPEHVPANIKAAILLIAGEWFEHREGLLPSSMHVIPNGAAKLLNGEKLGGLFAMRGLDQ